VYFIYSLLRGALTGQYLYPFGDVNALGHATVLVNGAFFVLGLIVVAIDHAIAWLHGQQGMQTPH
jgi:hypothetical protein